MHADGPRVREPALTSGKEQAARGSVGVVSQIIGAITRRNDHLGTRSEPQRACGIAEEASLEAELHIGDGVRSLLEIRHGAGELPIAQNATPARDVERARA